MDFLKGRCALAIAIGAIFGALSRFYVTEGAKAIFGKDFGFYGTFFINAKLVQLVTHVTQKSKKVSGTAIPSKTVVKP